MRGERGKMIEGDEERDPEISLSPLHQRPDIMRGIPNFV
jgi:hypothetical protein